MQATSSQLRYCELKQVSGNPHGRTDNWHGKKCANLIMGRKTGLFRKKKEKACG